MFTPSTQLSPLSAAEKTSRRYMLLATFAAAATVTGVGVALTQANNDDVFLYSSLSTIGSSVLGLLALSRT